MRAAPAFFAKNASHPPKEGANTNRERTARNVSVSVQRGEYPGLETVFERLQELARAGRGNPFIRKAALDITANISKDARTGHPDRRNRVAVANAVYAWMKTNIQYVRDPFMIEMLQTPEATLQLRSGDCDDMSVLAASLLGSLGIPVRFKIIGQDSKTKIFSHIYAEYQQTNGSWTVFDVVMATKPGDVPGNIVVSQTVLLDDVHFQPLDQKSMESVASGLLSDCMCAPRPPFNEMNGIFDKAKSFVSNNAAKIVNVGVNAATGNMVGAGMALVAKNPSSGGGAPAPAPVAYTPPPEPPKSNTMLYVGGAVAVVLLGTGIYFIARK